jgi:hypothetical protein
VAITLVKTPIVRAGCNEVFDTFLSLLAKYFKYCSKMAKSTFQLGEKRVLHHLP